MLLNTISMCHLNLLPRLFFGMSENAERQRMRNNWERDIESRTNMRGYPWKDGREMFFSWTEDKN